MKKRHADQLISLVKTLAEDDPEALNRALDGAGMSESDLAELLEAVEERDS